NKKKTCSQRLANVARWPISAREPYALLCYHIEVVQGYIFEIFCESLVIKIAATDASLLSWSLPRQKLI
ncbi:MAG: hypothetical protein J7J76_02860, partial [Candidatus Latescibacteria bacterium]|nr:hypothetical protein [Candidatus Latescibacterota bacterium]